MFPHGAVATVTVFGVLYSRCSSNKTVKHFGLQFATSMYTVVFMAKGTVEGGNPVFTNAYRPFARVTLPHRLKYFVRHFGHRVYYHSAADSDKNIKTGGSQTNRGVTRTSDPHLRHLPRPPNVTPYRGLHLHVCSWSNALR